MSKSNLIKDMEILLKDLETIDQNDYKALLSWFYKTIYYNNMFEESAIRNFVLEHLSNYDNNTGEEDYYISVRSLLINDGEPDEINIAKNLLAQIVRRLKLNEPLDANLMSFIRIYNERFNKLTTNEIMMGALRKNIGENIIYVCIKDGQFSLKNGVIDSVDDYQSISINGNKVPFIGYNVGIKTIYTNDGGYLYNNPHLNNNSDLVEYSAIENLKKVTFGKAYEDLKIIKF